MRTVIGNDWDVVLEKYFNSNRYNELALKIEEKYASLKMHPDKENLYKAFKLTSYKDTKVVIIGQDPYHEDLQATGLAFSVNNGIKLPPSLKNIYKEIEDEFGYKMSNNGDLSSWAEQGILLINNILMVEDSKPLSCKGLGFEYFTDYVISKLNQKTEPVIFVFWGKTANNKIAMITNPKHYVLTSNHPSPLSAYRGFFGNNHFIKINEILKKEYNYEIDFKI